MLRNNNIFMMGLCATALLMHDTNMRAGSLVQENKIPVSIAAGLLTGVASTVLGSMIAERSVPGRGHTPSLSAKVIGASACLGLLASGLTYATISEKEKQQEQFNKKYHSIADTLTQIDNLLPEDADNAYSTYSKSNCYNTCCLPVTKNLFDQVSHDLDYCVDALYTHQAHQASKYLAQCKAFKQEQEDLLSRYQASEAIVSCLRAKHAIKLLQEELPASKDSLAGLAQSLYPTSLWPLIDAISDLNSLGVEKVEELIEDAQSMLWASRTTGKLSSKMEAYITDTCTELLNSLAQQKKYIDSCKKALTSNSRYAEQLARFRSNEVDAERIKHEKKMLAYLKQKVDNFERKLSSAEINISYLEKADKELKRKVEDLRNNISIRVI